MERTSILTGCIAIFGVAAIALTPKPGAPVLALYNPAIEERQAIEKMANAGGFLIASTGVDWAVVTTSTDQNFTKNLRQNGAIFTFDPRIAAWCVPGLRLT